MSYLVTAMVVTSSISIFGKNQQDKKRAKQIKKAKAEARLRHKVKGLVFDEQKLQVESDSFVALMDMHSKFDEARGKQEVVLNNSGTTGRSANRSRRYLSTQEGKSGARLKANLSRQKANIANKIMAEKIDFNSTINKLNAQKLTGFQRAMGFLNAGISGASQGASIANIFGSSSTPDNNNNNNDSNSSNNDSWIA